MVSEDHQFFRNLSVTVAHAQQKHLLNLFALFICSATNFLLFIFLGRQMLWQISQKQQALFTLSIFRDLLSHVLHLIIQILVLLSHKIFHAI